MTESSHREARWRLYGRAIWSGAAARGVGMAWQLASVAIGVRALGTEQFGVCATLAELAVWLGLANFGLGNGLTVRLGRARGEDDARLAATATTSALALSAPLCGALLAVALVVGPSLSWERVFNVAASDDVRRAAVVALALVIASLPLGLGGSALTGHQRLDLVNASTLVTTLVGLGLLYASARLGGGLVAITACLFLPRVLAGAAQWALVARLGLVRLRRDALDLAEGRAALAIGVRFLLVQVLTLVTYQSGGLIVAQLFGADHVTPYAVTLRATAILPAVYGVLLAPLWPAAGEAYARGDLEWVRGAVRRAVLVVVGVWLLLSAALLVGGRPLIAAWTGDARAVPDLTLLGAGLAAGLALGVATALGQVLNGIGALRSQVVAGVVVAVAHVPLSIALCRAHGPAGVLLSQALLSGLVAIPLTGLHVRRLLRDRP